MVETFSDAVRKMMADKSPLLNHEEKLTEDAVHRFSQHAIAMSSGGTAKQPPYYMEEQGRISPGAFHDDAVKLAGEMCRIYNRQKVLVTKEIEQDIADNDWLNTIFKPINGSEGLRVHGRLVILMNSEKNREDIVWYVRISGKDTRIPDSIVPHTKGEVSNLIKLVHRQ